ncbi:MAG TPA: adenylosuccinate synthase [Anaerolineales bacterium]|nr:adenylosuccinate synthase [Anaerolineales bacterium]
MSLNIVVGAQWGDEGKGRIVDYLAAGADYVARYNGGDNAGHTVTVGGKIFKLHLVPSGIVHPHTTAVMGNGMVVNPRTLLDEMTALRSAGVSIAPQRMHISPAAHLITPAHRALDNANEAARGSGKIGTTGRGIGPAYMDKAARRGLRMADLLAPDFAERLRAHLLDSNRALNLLSAPELEVEAEAESYLDATSRLALYIRDVALELALALKQGQTVLAEGAQGTLLDLDHGTYPFVTSSATVAPAALTGLGLGIAAAREARVLGVTKAFQTRVGSGPFVTELEGEMADRLRGTGANPWDEFGTTTGRPRRVGWLDGVLLRYAVRVNGLTDLIITKLDILSGLSKIQLCTGYIVNNALIHDLPGGADGLSACAPVYEEFPGWRADITRVRRWKDLPKNAQKYLERISALAETPIKSVSLGPEREQILEV